MAEMTRVKCNACTKEVKGLCSVKKNIRVKINKKRTCNKFEFDKLKAAAIMQAKVIAEAIPTTMRPDWLHDKKLRCEVRKEAIKEYERQLAKAEGLKSEKAKVDFTTPDCLASIRSTASE